MMEFAGTAPLGAKVTPRDRVLAVAAYADHAWILGQKDREVNKFFLEAMSELLNEDITVDSSGAKSCDFSTTRKSHKTSARNVCSSES